METLVEYRCCSFCGVTKSLKENYYPFYSNKNRTYRKYCKTCYIKGVTSTIRLANSLRKHLHRVIRTKKTSEEVGCTWEQLKEHIETQFREGMFWDNWGRYGWHLDHIKPISKGGTNHFTNLQPLWAEENLKKSNKII